MAILKKKDLLRKRPNTDYYCIECLLQDYRNNDLSTHFSYCWKCFSLRSSWISTTKSCCGQVLALTTYIEFGLTKRLKTGVVFLNHLNQFYKIVPCKWIVSFIESMLNKKFRVFIGEKSSKAKTLNNGLSQDAAFCSLFFNVYTSNFSNTILINIVYTANVALTFQHKKFVQLKKQLFRDASLFCDYFKQWSLHESIENHQFFPFIYQIVIKTKK